MNVFIIYFIAGDCHCISTSCNCHYTSLCFCFMQLLLLLYFCFLQLSCCLNFVCCLSYWWWQFICIEISSSTVTIVISQHDLWIEISHSTVTNVINHYDFVSKSEKVKGKRIKQHVNDKVYMHTKWSLFWFSPMSIKYV